MRRKKGNYEKMPLDYEKVKAHIMSLGDRETKLFGLVVLLAGMRVGEVVQCRAEDVTGTTIRVRKTKVREGQTKYRAVPVPEWARRTILDLKAYLDREPDDYLFKPTTRGGEQLTRGAANARVKRIFEGVEIKGQIPTCHTLRKTVAEQLRKVSGNDFMVPQQHLGHKSITSTVRYLDNSRQRYLDVAEQAL